jgi:hypothetical protein
MGQEGMKRFITHMKFSGENEVGLQADLNMAGKSQERRPAWFL